MKEFASALQTYHNLSCYMSAAMLYLQSNTNLTKEIEPEHIKPRILGHWGTVPGIALVYGGISALINKYKIESTLLVTGPGHGAPAIIAGLYLEGALQEYYPDATLDAKGLEYVIRNFSWPGGFPSHTYPGLPGQIHEGGELGYSLGTAFGSVLDKPNLLSVCIVGDGEAETGPLAASWHSNKFINHKKDGVVFPILHLNGYKISGPTIFSTMSSDEINAYFWSLGYEPWILDKSQYETDEKFFEAYLDALDGNYKRIIEYKEKGTRLPILILKTPKGWGGPKYNAFEEKLEDNNLSHGIPLKHPKTNNEELEILSLWLKSYNIDIFQTDSEFNLETFSQIIPKGFARMGANIFASGNPPSKELILPNISDLSTKIEDKGEVENSSMNTLARYVSDVFKLNEENANFRLFSPDETESNLLDPIFNQTGRVYNRKLRSHDKFYSADGRIMEILSEHVLQEWMQAYVLTGGNGILVSYEAFLGIIASQIDQYAKFIKQSKEFGWRKPVASLNYIATSTAWRQDHNGFSHQNPTMIQSLIQKGYDFASIYFPVDSNTLLASVEDSLKSKDTINLIVVGKTNLPQWLDINEAREHVSRGISVWKWASNMRSNFTDPTNSNSNDASVDVVLACCGDYQTQETLAATQILKEIIPELAFQTVNINELTTLGLGDEQNPIMTASDYEKYFTKSKPVIFNFHGYPATIKQLLWDSIAANRTTILGYNEKGSTTTPFDMQVLNKSSRYHVAMQAIIKASDKNPFIQARSEQALQYLIGILQKHRRYIEKYGKDIPEVENFEWNFDINKEEYLKF